MTYGRNAITGLATMRSARMSSDTPLRKRLETCILSVIFSVSWHVFKVFSPCFSTRIDWARPFHG